MPAACRLLHVEDSLDDADLVRLSLAQTDPAIVITRVDTEAQYVANLDREMPDAILCDYHLPRFSAERALAILRERGLDVPFIIVSHHIGESAAVVAMQQGASDYLPKHDLARLPKAIAGAIERSGLRAERARAEEALRRSEALRTSVLDSLSARIAVLDPDGVVRATNRAWDEFGHQRALVAGSAARVGDNYLDLLRAAASAGDLFARESLEAIAAVVDRRQTFGALEYRASLGGGMRSFVLRAFPFAGSDHGVVVSHQDVSDRIMAHLALEDAHRRLQALSRRMLSLQEDERRTISRELHDDVGQSLAALRIGLHRAAEQCQGRARELLAECMDIVESSVERLRQISQELRPPQLEQLGLAEALSWLAERQRGATGIEIECRFTGLDGPRPAPAVESACYRIAQEAINNATRHGRAQALVVSAQVDARLLRLTIHDNGIGFDEQPTRRKALNAGSMGLISMEERAQLAGGRLRVRSLPGQGTTVTALFPLGEPVVTGEALEPPAAP